MERNVFKHIQLHEALALIRGDEIESNFPRQLISLIHEALQPYVNQPNDDATGDPALTERLSEAMLIAEKISTPDAADDDPNIAVAHQKGRLLHIACKLSEALDTEDLNALFIFQVDRLVGQSITGDLDAALYTFADMMEISWLRESIFVEDYSSTNVKIAARRSARIRHAPLTEIKNSVLRQWDETKHEYESQADFCRIVSALFKLKYRTTYDWISAHKKNHS